MYYKYDFEFMCMSSCSVYKSRFLGAASVNVHVYINVVEMKRQLLKTTKQKVDSYVCHGLVQTSVPTVTAPRGTSSVAWSGRTNVSAGGWMWA